MAEATKIEKEINPYDGMEMAPSNTGNGEIHKVEDLITNPLEPSWEPTVDTLINQDSDTANLHERLSANPAAPEVNKTIKIEDLMNMKPDSVKDNYENLHLKDDQLINDLTGILNM